MTLTYLAGRTIVGTNSDRTGGTWTNLPAGWRFIENDTFLMYLWTGSAWTLITEKSVTETLTNKTLDGSDTSNTVKVPMILRGDFNLTPLNGIRYQAIFSATQTSNATESKKQLILFCNFALKKIRCRIDTNTSSATFTVGLRDDGASLGLISVTTGDTSGELTTGALTDIIAAGSAVNFILDMTGLAATGVITIHVLAEGYAYR
jgi:hypothetical protein